MRGDTVTARFREAMLHEIRANEYKGDWLTSSERTLRRELDYHVAKLRAAVRAGDTPRITEFAADVANHAMFVADKQNALWTGAIARRQSEPSYVFPSKSFWFYMIVGSPRWAVRTVWKLVHGGLKKRRRR